MKDGFHGIMMIPPKIPFGIKNGTIALLSPRLNGEKSRFAKNSKSWLEGD
jgi:hypothetical protein